MQNEIVEKIKSGSIGVIPTDTIYGISASINHPVAIERIYELTSRPKDKPFIILISRLEELNRFGIYPSQLQAEALKKLWPGPHSVIFKVDDPKLEYLHRGKSSLAIRLPRNKSVLKLIRQTGPIVATSANRSGEPTPDNIDEIKEKLPSLDFYEAGMVGSEPSKLVRLHDDGSLDWISRQR